MVLHNPNNWHWVSKNASAWTREYLDKELIGTSVEENGVSAKIDKVISMEGDVDVSQRKGKVITLFDVQLQLEYGGKTKDDDEANGTITIPEVAHDTEEDEYVFEIDIYTETPTKLPVKDLVRRRLTPLLRKKLANVGPALISAHAKDLQHAADAEASSSTAAPKHTSNTKETSVPKQSAPSKPATTTTSNSAAAKVNTTTLTASDEFRTSADQLYATFTDPQRLAAFTRAPPKKFTGAQVGGEFELFGGNVAGKYVELAPSGRIVQEWRLQQWPAGHYSRLELVFDQNDVDAVTVMRVSWKGVPVGQEEVTRKNWGEYYVRSIKTTFGFGTML